MKKLKPLKTLSLTNETYIGKGKDFGSLEAYRSNTVGKKYLRLNVGCKIDNKEQNGSIRLNKRQIVKIIRYLIWFLLFEHKE